MGLRVLVVDADVTGATERASELTHSGHVAVRVSDAAGAAEVLMRESIDSIVCSDAMRAEIERAYGSLIPVIPSEGQPTALLAKTLARLARRSMSPTAQLSLAAQLDGAIAEATLALEPIIDLREGVVRAHRANVMTNVSQEDLAGIAAELGRVRELRRAVRNLACEAIERGGVARLLLECGIEDLMDPQLYDEASTWAKHAKSILLTVAERDVLVLAERDARERLRALRGLGFSLVVRIGTDIAGLTSVGVVVPAYGLLDVAAFGDSGPVVMRVVASVVSACREVGVDVIADVANVEQMTCARDTGCALAVGSGAIVGPSA